MEFPHEKCVAWKYVTAFHGASLFKKSQTTNNKESWKKAQVNYSLVFAQEG